jgi:hypothetical protein
MLALYSIGWRIVCAKAVSAPGIWDRRHGGETQCSEVTAQVVFPLPPRHGYNSRHGNRGCSPGRRLRCFLHLADSTDYQQG